MLEPAVVKLAPCNHSWRLVGATNAMSYTLLNAVPALKSLLLVHCGQVSTSVNQASWGNAQVSPTADLAAGEDAVILGPIAKSKRFSGAEVAEIRAPDCCFIQLVVTVNLGEGNRAFE